MKSFFLIAFSLIGISIACVPNKGSQSSANNSTPINQPSEQPGNSTEQSSSNCSLTMAAAPAINGLKLGMTSEEVLALFPGSKDDPDVRRYLVRSPDQFGDAELVIRPSRYQPKNEPMRIKQIGFGLLDGRVYSIN